MPNGKPPSQLWIWNALTLYALNALHRERLAPSFRIALIINKVRKIIKNRPGLVSVNTTNCIPRVCRGCRGLIAAKIVKYESIPNCGCAYSINFNQHTTKLLDCILHEAVTEHRIYSGAQTEAAYENVLSELCGTAPSRQSDNLDLLYEQQVRSALQKV